MGRRPSYTAEVAARIAELAASGMTAVAIREKLLSEGLEAPSTRTVMSVARSAKAKAPSPRRGKSRAPKSRDEPPAPAAVDVAEASALVSTLEGAVRTMEGVVSQIDPRQADAMDVKLLNQTFRTLSQVVAQIQRMTPPEPPDPNQNPDILADAERCREILFKYLEDARQGKSQGRAGARPKNSG